LALALSLATIAEFTTLAYLIARRMPSLLDAGLVGAIGRMVLSTALMSAVLGAALLILHKGSDFDQPGPALVALVLGSSLGGLTYVIASTALGLDEPRQLFSRIRRRP